MRLTHILAAVGQFPQDEAVLARALELAATQDVALTVAHIVDLPGSDAILCNREALNGQAARAARETIESALTSLGADPATIPIVVETGSPALRLIDLCETLRPDLVVMRAHQRQKIAEKILGSTTDRLIAAGLAPVLVVRRPVDRPYGRVLLATNGEDDASDTLSFVQGMLPRAALHLVQAVHIAPQLEEAMLRVGTDQGALTTHLDALERTARAQLQALAADITPRPTVRVLRGAPTTALIRATRRPDVDLIAVGPGRTSLIRRTFIGSVTRRLLRDAACDVLICHPLPDGSAA